MGNQRKLLNKKILIIAALLSVIGSAAYACTYMSGVTPSSYSFCTRISYVGMPGILLAAVLSIALHGGHGGGPLGELLGFSTTINFLLYAGLCLAIQSLWRFFRKWSGESK